MRPMTAGLGLKPQHFAQAHACRAAGLWFEVHPENYMVDGGPRLAWLDRIRAEHPLSLHGVALSLAAAGAPDPAHLERLASLVDRMQPELVSEHVAWSTWRGAYRPDLLPVPRTREALHWIVANAGRVQDRLRRRIAIENPSHYLAFDEHEYDEIGFLTEVAQRSGCALLVDVNNAYVSARNLGMDAQAWVDAVPAALVAEIHLAGHSADPALGAALLVDSHDAPVAPAVWALYERLVARIGPRPTLIERDDKIPPFDELLAERDRAHALLGAARADRAWPEAA
jgi:uncharacterized protein (UPF0276 family)